VSAWRKHRRWLIGQVALWGLLVLVLRVAVVPAETCPSVDAAAVERAARAGGEWLARGQREDGRFVYGYHRDEDTVSSEYNTTRHAGVMSALYELGRIDAADAALGYVRENLFSHEDWTAFAPFGEYVDVGANALVVVALMYRRESTGERRYDGLARRIGRFLVSQQQADGSILQYWLRSMERSVPGVFGKFATGEAFYAMALLDRAFPAQRWDRHAHQVAEYLATRRDEVEGGLREPDHWAAYGLATLASSGLTATEVEYARWLAGYFGYLIRYESQHQGSALNQLSESGASLGTDGEAAAALWRLAGTDPRLADLRERLGDRVSCSAGILVDRQASPSHPDRLARGAWFDDGYTQMDDQQHAIAALLGAHEVLVSARLEPGSRPGRGV
jgi:hypothetical protein